MLANCPGFLMMGVHAVRSGTGRAQLCTACRNSVMPRRLVTEAREWDHPHRTEGILEGEGAGDDSKPVKSREKRADRVWEGHIGITNVLVLCMTSKGSKKGSGAVERTAFREGPREKAADGQRSWARSFGEGRFGPLTNSLTPFI